MARLELRRYGPLPGPAQLAAPGHLLDARDDDGVDVAPAKLRFQICVVERADMGLLDQDVATCSAAIGVPESYL
jgi:hypothetical protein